MTTGTCKKQLHPYLLEVQECPKMKTEPVHNKTRVEDTIQALVTPCCSKIKLSHLFIYLFQATAEDFTLTVTLSCWSLSLQFPSLFSPNAYRSGYASQWPLHFFSASVSSKITRVSLPAALSANIGSLLLQRGRGGGVAAFRSSRGSLADPADDIFEPITAFFLLFFLHVQKHSKASIKNTRIAYIAYWWLMICLMFNISIFCGERIGSRPTILPREVKAKISLDRSIPN